MACRFPLRYFADVRWSLGGANALEQRPESVPSDSCKPAQVPLNMTEEGDTSMKESNTTDAPRWSLDYVNCFLTALHVLVLLTGLVFHLPVDPGADRALPQVTAL